MAFYRVCALTAFKVVFINSIKRSNIVALTKAKKKDVLEKLGGIFKDSLSVVFVNFRGLTATDTANVRKALAASGIGFTVAKKTLIRRALSTDKVSGEVPELGGELAIAYGADQIAPAREIFSFQKKFENKISILGGVFEKVFVDQQKMLAIALIPDRKTLEAQFVNLINSPIQRIVVALSEIAKKQTV
ncbi:MAG: 50S ribosomal protein L10 [Patescibacteria group bacterium]